MVIGVSSLKVGGTIVKLTFCTWAKPILTVRKTINCWYFFIIPTSFKEKKAVKNSLFQKY
jgi:hypothetical protein